MEDREFRVFASSKGDEPVLQGIIGEAELERQIPYLREAYPDDTLYVREVLETVVRVYKPGEEVIILDN
jgi:hypothetical protein